LDAVGPVDPAASADPVCIHNADAMPARASATAPAIIFGRKNVMLLSEDSHGESCSG
jgi:hypothetical protein